MKEYLNLLEHIIKEGIIKKDRTGIGTKSIFGYQMRFNLTKGFPIITTKKIFFKSIVYELLWFLKGETNNNYLINNGVNIWTPWANKNGDLGPIYGKQWRFWETEKGEIIDQIKNTIDLIKLNPNSRRIIVNSWNPSVLPDETKSSEQNINNGKAVLPPCHTLFQFYVVNKKISCMVYQRSADVFLGLPFNIASYALLLHMVGKQCNLEIRELIWSGGDCHIYNNHYTQIKEQLSRNPLLLPKLYLNSKVKSIFDYKFCDIHLKNYKYHPQITAPIAI